MRAVRIVWLMTAVALLFAGLVARLFWLQGRPVAVTGEASSLVRKSVAQRRADVVLDEGRGFMVDRNGLPLAGIPTRSLLVDPSRSETDVAGRANATDKEGTEKSGRMGLTDEEAFAELDGPIRQIGQTGPELWRLPGEREPVALTDRQVAAVSRSHQVSLAVVPYRRRYDTPPIAAHLIGFVLQRDRIGAAGLERSFEAFLRARGNKRLSFYRTATGEPLQGLDVRLVEEGSPHYPLTLALTLDAGLQRQVERLLHEAGIEDGTAIVLDVNNGDILAMASAPAYDPYHVVPEAGLWRNRALMAEVPGSVFKTAIAAAALETGVTAPGETFTCSGRHNRGRIRCHHPGGHGRLTLEEAYARSCNVVFAELALRLGADGLKRAAARIGIGAPAGWRADRWTTPLADLQPFAQLDGEETGQLFDSNDVTTDPATVAMTGIGQHSVRLTPLQVTQWTAAIASGGKLPAVRAVSRVCWNNGRVLTAFPAKSVPAAGFSTRTVRWLKSAMVQTANSGTASMLAGVPGGVGGKTGTAETGRAGLVHQWFTGFYPVATPRYAVTIVTFNRPADSRHLATATAERLFRLLHGNDWKTDGER